MRTVIVVEGVTDELALTLAAQRLGRNLAAEGVSVVPTNGAHAISRSLRQLAAEQPRANLAGLYDEAEEEVIRAALEQAGYGPDLDRSRLEVVGFFACSADLEDELIRAAGERSLATLVEIEGDTQPWRTFRNQRAWRGRPFDQQFRRFIRSVSERNPRYVRAIVETIDPSRLPRPLRRVLDYVEPGRPRPPAGVEFARMPAGVAGDASDKLTQLKQILAEVTHLDRAAKVLEWDQETYMPPGGVQGRADQLSTLLRLSHVKFTSDEVGRLLDSLEGEMSNEPYDSDNASIVRVTRRDYEHARKVPADLVAEIATAGSTALPVWAKARREADFGIFAPYLARNVELNRRLAEALGYDDRPYDALLDHSEPGMTTKQLTRIFGELKNAIVPLIASIAHHQDAVDDSVLHRGFEPDLQLAYAVDVVKRLGYDFERGRQDISAHPFSIGIGPGDVRITTRVSRNFFNECLFGSIHESGHAMYSQGLASELDNTRLWDAASPGVDESQSRLWENVVGRSLPFWRHFYPSLRSTFPEQLRGVDEVAFYRALNKSEPSYIRVEADEVTYNMHVLLRFEIENELLEGKLRVGDVPEAWNTRFNSYLGLVVPNDSEGVLQDIHWSAVSFGIFPGYTIGNLISAQLSEQIRVDIPDLDAQIEGGSFAALLGWLRQKVHRHGRKFTPNELLERATGKPLTAAPWIAYVRSKFGTLYELEAARR